MQKIQVLLEWNEIGRKDWSTSLSARAKDIAPNSRFIGMKWNRKKGRVLFTEFCSYFQHLLSWAPCLVFVSFVFQEAEENLMYYLA